MIPDPKDHYTNLPIPTLKSLDWDQVSRKNVTESGEELVSASLIPERILVRPEYFFQGIPQALPHLTGGAVDLTLADDKGILLDMGTEFDATCPQSHTRYFEEKLEQGEPLSPNEQLQTQNRRLLFHVMAETGFTNYPNEWWHFDYGNQNWAFMHPEENHSAIYGPIHRKCRWS